MLNYSTRTGRLTRRRMLALSGVVSAAVLAECNDDPEDEEEPEDVGDGGEDVEDDVDDGDEDDDNS